MRNPIQISTFRDDQNNCEVVCALCDDGTIWVSHLIDSRNFCEHTWHQLNPIPQDDSQAI